METLVTIKTDTPGSLIYKDDIILTLKYSPDMCIIIDQDFLIEYVNPKTYHLTKQKKDNLVRQQLRNLFPKNQAVFFASLMEELYFKGKLYNKNTFFRVIGQKSIPVSVSIFPLIKNEKQSGFLLTARDNLTDHEYHQTLQEKNRELETFVYRVSHDLKGPLASVKGLLELVELEENNVATLRQYIQLIKKSTQKLESTLSGLLEIGVSNNKKISNSTLNIKDCVEDVVKSFEAYPGIKDVIFLISINKDLQVCTEEKTFRSILQNLVENSIKYRKPKVDDSVTKISARRYRNGIKIKVKDNGQGMEKQILNKAFDMFFRGNHSAEGSGLGLFIVKSNIKRLGGQLKVESVVNHGTEMCIFLPNQTTKRHGNS